MRKKLVAMLGAMIGLVAMATVASAGTITVDYDAVNSTASVAKYNVYADGVSGSVKNLQLVLDFAEDTVVDLTNFTSDKVTYQEGLENCKATINASKKQAKIQTYSSDSLAFTFDESEPIIVMEMPVSSNAAKSAFTVTIKGQFTDDTPTVNVENILPQTAVVADSTVVDDNAEAAKATYWTVEANLVEGATPYWYAKVNDAAKKVEANVPSVSGAAKLGLIVEGDDVVTDVKIVQE